MNGHLITLFVGLVSFLGGGALTSAGYIYTHGARLSVVEVEVNGLRDQLLEVNRKLDHLLARPLVQPAVPARVSAGCRCDPCECPEPCRCRPPRERCECMDDDPERRPCCCAVCACARCQCGKKCPGQKAAAK